jgi:hypothetical protein
LASTVTMSGDEAFVQSQIDNVLLILPPDYEGEITITETRTEPTPLTRDIKVPVVRYDDGSYEATLQNLKTLVTTPGAPSVATTQAVVSPAVAPTGVRGGIDWNTLRLLGRGSGQSTDPGSGKSYVTTGNIWEVKTVIGTTLTVLEADPLGQQPAASRAIPTFQDPSYNCHGYTFGATGVVCPDGNTRSFEITQDVDVKMILSESYTQVTVDQAFAAAGTKNLYFVFYKNGEALHSAVNAPGQSFSKSTFFGFSPGLAGSTVVGSKNGDQNFRANTTIKALLATYPGTDVKIYVSKP